MVLDGFMVMSNEQCSNVMLPWYQERVDFITWQVGLCKTSSYVFVINTRIKFVKRTVLWYVSSCHETFNFLFLHFMLDTPDNHMLCSR